MRALLGSPAEDAQCRELVHGGQRAEMPNSKGEAIRCGRRQELPDSGAGETNAGGGGTASGCRIAGDEVVLQVQRHKGQQPVLER